MLFSNDGRGFGLTPVMPGGGPVIANQGSAPATNAGEASGKTPNDVCTSDGKLAYVGGAWRVRSLENDACSGGMIPSEDVNYIKASGQPVFVGPFQIDLKATGGQITTLENPAQIGKDWAGWLQQAYTAQLSARVAAKLKADPTFNALPYFRNKVPLYSALPRVIGSTHDVADNGTANGLAAPPNPMCAAISDAAYYNPTQCPAVTFPIVQPALASGGHALHPSHAWFATDASGFRFTNVQYDGDPNTYSYYSADQWLQALGLLEGGLWSGVTYDYLKPSNTTEFNRNQNLPPIAKFVHPITGENWGLWVSIGPKSGNLSSTQPGDGDWDTGLDAPASHIMQIGMAPLPQEGWWDDFIDALLWIPTALGNLLFDIGKWLGEMTCDLSHQANLTKALPKDPATQASALAALALFNQTCPGKIVVDCKNPDNINNPACVALKPVAPWWKQWYVVIPALGLLGFGIFKALGNKPRSQPAT